MWFHRLRAQGILGMNRRNALYTLAMNPRERYPLVDDKLKTKELAARFAIPTPKLLGSATYHHELKHLGELLASHPEFVIKPVHGAMGNGVLVVDSHDDRRFRKPSGAVMSLQDVRHYVSGIISGLYSLGGQVDAAMVETRLHVHPFFSPICALGVPDIRVIVYKGVPVMSMTRLPTKESDGRANLHQGAIAAGIHILTGVTRRAVHRNKVVQVHPDTGHTVEGLQIPHWDAILRMAAKAHDMTALGYIGVDIVLDRDLGPQLLELNARPGLSIQVANGAGLWWRLDAVDRLGLSGATPGERIEMGQRALAPLLAKAVKS